MARHEGEYNPDAELDAIVAKEQADATSLYYHASMTEHYATSHPDLLSQGWIRLSTEGGAIFRFELKPIAFVTLGVITNLARGNMVDLGLEGKAIALEETMANIIHFPPK